MQDLLSTADGGDILRKADGIAEKLSEHLECDAVYISVANRNRLFSFGMKGGAGTTDADRFHESADTVCAKTISKNELVALSDARLNDEYSDIAYVDQGAIVGYVGQPIRNSEGGVIGAICGISRTPRIWSDADKLSLQLACLEVECLLSTELLKSELAFLSRALGEYDTVVLALTQNMCLMSSVHDAQGEVLFASKCLLDEIDAENLEAAFRDSRVAAISCSEKGQVRSVENLDPEPAQDNVLVVQSLKTATSWHGSVEQCPGPVYFVSWTADQPDAG